jgi:hypothetical protein
MIAGIYARESTEQTGVSEEDGLEKEGAQWTETLF